MTVRPSGKESWYILNNFIYTGPSRTKKVHTVPHLRHNCFISDTSMPQVRTFLFISATLLIVTVAYGAIYVDPRFTVLLLPPLLAFFACDERYLPETVAEAMRNPKPLSKLILSVAGLYFGFKIVGFDFVSALGLLLNKKQAGNVEL